jgi:uncharacterized protein YndB with AHSA1/START domain
LLDLPGGSPPDTNEKPKLTAFYPHGLPELEAVPSSLWRQEALAMTTQAAQVSTELDTSLQVAWNALTNPDVLGKALFGSQVETSWKVGEPITFCGEWRGKHFEDKGQILAFSPPKQLRFSHFSTLSGLEEKPENFHVLTFELLPGAKTTVQLTQENENDKPLDEGTRAELEKNWTAALDGLKTVIEKTYGRRSD